jgi:hypothetical protein
LTITREQPTFTLAATDSEMAALDAAQYLDGGPCVDVGENDGDIHQFSVADFLDEDCWQLFAAATAAHGVTSTLSLAVYHDGELVGGVNLYATTPDAFDGRVEDLAALVGGTVHTGDLQRRPILLHQARGCGRTPETPRPSRHRDRYRPDRSRQRDRIENARQQLLDAAARAGILLAQVARVVVSVFDSQR